MGLKNKDAAIEAAGKTVSEWFDALRQVPGVSMPRFRRCRCGGGDCAHGAWPPDR